MRVKLVTFEMSKKRGRTYFRQKQKFIKKFDHLEFQMEGYRECIGVALALHGVYIYTPSSMLVVEPIEKHKIVVHSIPWDGFLKLEESYAKKSQTVGGPRRLQTSLKKSKKSLPNRTKPR